MTDWALYDLSSKLPVFKYRSFTRKEESRFYGADFDYWILGKTKHVACRIQAKRIKKNENHYPALAYPNRNKKQNDLLLSSSQNDNLRPFYLFYSNMHSQPNCPQLNYNPGILIADAFNVQSKFLVNKAKVRDLNIIKECMPWECMFCCPLSGTSDNTEGIIKFLENYFPLLNGYDGLGIRGDLPGYVKDLIDPEKTEDFWDQEYRKVDLETKGVCVLDLREL